MAGMQFHYIANAAQPSSSGRTIPVIDPSDGQPFDELQRGTADDINAAVNAARHCYEGVWRKLSAAERGRLLMRLSNKVAEHADELAALGLSGPSDGQLASLTEAERASVGS